MASQFFQMVMRSGPTPGKVFPLEKNEIFIGRDVNNDVVISDSEVSRKHARITFQAGGHVLEDLGSTNGTFVNGQRLMGPHLLRQGELIMFGENVSLTFEPGFDPDATQVSTPGPVAVYPSGQPTYEPSPPPIRQEYPAVPPASQDYPPVPPTRQEYAPPPQPRPAPQQTYSGQVPQGPAEPFYEPEPYEEPRRSRSWVYAGCGCLLVLACLLVAGAYAFDYLDLYCTPPFNILFACP